ncbi:MAG: CotH kinase family protein [Eubacteriales bacterium]
MTVLQKRFLKRVLAALLSAVFVTALFGCGKNIPPEDIIVPPTCEESGYTISYTSDGKEQIGAFTPPLGHEFVLSEISPPNCEEGGYETYICSRCGEKKTVYEKASGHVIELKSYSLLKGVSSYTLLSEGKCGECGQFVRIKEAVFGFGLDNGFSASPASVIDVPGEGGGISITIYGGTVTLEATPAEFFRFKGWSSGQSEPVLTFAADEIYSLDAIFEYDFYNMPVVNINTFGKEVVRLDSYTPCEVTITNCPPEYELKTQSAGIRVRGNASANYGDEDWIRVNKVHYRLKFDSKKSLLGLNSGAKCKSWVLLRGDNHFIKEPISFYMGKQLLGEGYFVSDYTYAEVYFNNEYMGVYILCDQIQVNENRVDVKKIREGDTTLKNGYLLEIDNYYTKEPFYFTINYGEVRLTDMYGVTYKTPTVGYSVKSDYLTNEQLSFIKNYILNAYQIVYKAIWEGECFEFDDNFTRITPAPTLTPREAVEKVMDVDSLVGMYVLQELCEERDVGIGSFFMYVDLSGQNPKLTFCAPWDFSWAFGDDTGFRYDKFSTSAWQPREFISSSGNRSSTWFITLYKAEWFKELVKQKWTSASENGVFDGLIAEMSWVSDTYENEFAKNSVRWGSGDQRAASQRIAGWLEKRINWLSEQWLA